MSELAETSVQETTVGSGPFSAVSAGTLLRQARESAGLHIAALAVTLKVPVKKLEALEADRIDLLPDAVFARALAASVCRTLKTDATPILASLPQANLSQFPSQARVAATAYSTPSPETRTAARNQLSRPVILIASALLIGALAIVFLPSAENLVSSFSLTRNAVPKPLPIAVAPSAPAADGSNQPPLIASTVLAGTGLPDIAAMNANPPSVGPGAKPLTSSPAMPETDASKKPSLVDEVVVLKSLGSAWVEVLDGKRTVRLRKTMSPGETVGVSADLPMYVTVGRADTIEVQVRGKPLDLVPLTKDNVARFEVRQ